VGNTNLLLSAFDTMFEHFKALESGSIVNEQFLSEHRVLVERTQGLIEAFLLESASAERSYKVLQESRDAELARLQARLDGDQTQT
jgi:hypothetical protein